MCFVVNLTSVVATTRPRAKHALKSRNDPQKWRVYTDVVPEVGA